MNRRKVIFRGVVLIIVLAVAGLTKSISENIKLRSELQSLKEDPQRVAKEETGRVVSMVEKLVILPTDEEPVLATVTDKEKLKDQPVFAKADNGDKILIYSKSQKAYIYSPSKNVIVDVVPVNIGNSAVGITGVDEDNPLKIALLNGTETAGVTNTLENRIREQKVLGLSVTSKANAKKNDYKTTQVIDLTGKWGAQAKEIASLVGGEVTSDTDEDKPSADLMIIVGENFK